MLLVQGTILQRREIGDKMEIFILSILLVLIGYLGVCLCLDYYDMNQRIVKKCIKSKNDLLMENEGDDPCAEDQVIRVNQHFCETKCWIVEDKR